MSKDSGSNGSSGGGSQGGRPPKDPEKKRTESHGLWLSKQEKQELEERAESAGLSLSEYIRRRALGKQIQPKADRALRGELGAIGNNINQIARRANRNEMEGLEEMAEAAFERLHEVLRELQQDS